MGLNETVSAQRIHIGFFGLRNAGKSSLVNAVTGQNLSVVSDIKGTTTDPVKKAMELLPLGAVVIIDTPGTDDEGELGQLRVKRAKQTLNICDIAVLAVDSRLGLQNADRELIELFKAKNIPFIIAKTKSDLLSDEPLCAENEIYVSAKSGKNIYELKEKIGKFAKSAENDDRIVADLLSEGDHVILVTPIDSSAPKGRLILPQQQTIRDILDCGAFCTVCKHQELSAALDAFGRKPKLVITDSQVFGYVNKIVPADVPLTSFSILFARYKGSLLESVKGAKALSSLKNGDTVLISEGCTHHRQCEDIGTVKLPNLIRKYTGKELNFEFTSGGEFPESLAKYALIVHCGGCMLNRREINSRIDRAVRSGVPITNYGIAIAQMHGILDRSISIFN